MLVNAERSMKAKMKSNDEQNAKLASSSVRTSVDTHVFLSKNISGGESLEGLPGIAFIFTLMTDFFEFYLP